MSLKKNNMKKRNKNNSSLEKTTNSSLYDSLSDIENKFVEVRLNNPHYDIDDLCRCDEMYGVSKYEVTQMWIDANLSSIISSRLKDDATQHLQGISSRFLNISKDLVSILQDKVEDYRNNVDNPRDLMMVEDMTAHQAALISKSTLFNTTPEALAKMSRDLAVASREIIGDVSEGNDRHNIIEYLSLNYHTYKDIEINEELFSADDGFEGEHRIITSNKTIDVVYSSTDDDDEETTD